MTTRSTIYNRTTFFHTGFLLITYRPTKPTEIHETYKSVTRGLNLKLVNAICHYDFRKYSFVVRVVNIWNSLPDSVISVNNVNTFKNR